MMRTRRDGFTLVELLIVVLIIGVLVRIAVPRVQTMIHRARAAEALSYIRAVRIAAYDYFSQHHEWPPDESPGVVPPGLEPLLSDGFSFTREHYQLDWDNWVLPDGTPKHPETGVLIGVSVTTGDERLGHALEQLVGEETLHWTLNENYTFVIAAM